MYYTHTKYTSVWKYPTYNISITREFVCILCTFECNGTLTRISLVHYTIYLIATITAQMKRKWPKLKNEKKNWKKKENVKLILLWHLMTQGHLDQENIYVRTCINIIHANTCSFF